MVDEILCNPNACKKLDWVAIWSHTNECSLVADLQPFKPNFQVEIRPMTHMSPLILQFIGPMQNTVVRLLAALSLLIGSQAIAQTPPVPWNGTRDQSCEQYHSTKYKSPIYSAEAINDHLVHVLAVDNTPC